MRKNRAPATVWEALRRLRDCNRQELAAALGISRHTLARWEDAAARNEQLPEGARERAASLLIATLRAADGADALAQWGRDWHPAAEHARPRASR